MPLCLPLNQSQKERKMENKEIKVIRDKFSGYPDVPAMLAQMDDWTPEEKFCNQFWRLNNLYKIVDKTSRVVTFVMKPEQADLYCAIRKHPRHVICKSRQLGFSTFIQIFYLDCAIFNSNENVFIIAQDKDAASAIMETKIKFAYNNLPPEIKETRKVVKSNSDEFLLNNNSKITVTVSARSATATRIHSSEMAKSYIKDPEKTHEFWTGTLPALIPVLAVSKAQPKVRVGTFMKLITIRRWTFHKTKTLFSDISILGGEALNLRPITHHQGV